MKLKSVLRMVIGVLLAASLAGNVWLATRVRAQQEAAQFAFGESAWTITRGMGAAFGSLNASRSGERADWLVPFQQIQVVQEHADAASRLRPFMDGKRRLIAEQYWDLRIRLVELNYIIGQLIAGEDSDRALLAVHNWEKIYAQIDWPTGFRPTEEDWTRLHRSLEQLLAATDELRLKCLSVPGNVGPSENNPTYRYACE